ncbi:MAG: hypothetical protein ACYS99_05995, partial [Planctomycetota bacterium]
MNRILLLHAILLLSILAGCQEPEPEPPALEPVLRVDTDSPELVADAQAALEEAGVTAEFRPVGDVAVDDRPAWAADEESGWLLFIRPDQKDRAMAAYETWKDGLGGRTKESEPKPPPEPAELGSAEPLPPERLKAIRTELARRLRLDQEARRSRWNRAVMEKV